jgi:hypothetical protein
MRGEPPGLGPLRLDRTAGIRRSTAAMHDVPSSVYIMPSGDCMREQHYAHDIRCSTSEDVTLHILLLLLLRYPAAAVHIYELET